jgi:NADP-dependent 3-hydroxy acid dehydrogenase YdfG
VIVHDEEPRPGDGEESYVGKGLLAGRAALITGRDPGIGRAVAIAYAREGADVAIAYLETDRTCWLRRESR